MSERGKAERGGGREGEREEEEGRLVNRIGSCPNEGRQREEGGEGEELEKEGVVVERQGREAEIESQD